jgi:superfamily I DNA/RNA helicase
MDFRIADTFTTSLAKLTAEEQKAVKTTAFDAQLNPAHPGLQLHKLERAKDAKFWSMRVSADIRLIVHRTESSFLLCYVGHHDDAYHWAERRKLETHPKTGAAQFVEIRETVVEIPRPVYVQQSAAKPSLFAKFTDEELLGLGLPTEWLADVKAADEDSILTIADHLPAEAAEALLDLATGAKPKPRPLPVAVADPFQHPDALRRFRSMGNIEELARALDYPWEKWTIFLHPAQRQLVERDFQGPARVSGTAGTGKTIVALHRAVHLAKSDPNGRILLTTFTGALAGALQSKLRRLIGNEPSLGERIEVHALDDVAGRLYRSHFGPPKAISEESVLDLIQAAGPAINKKLTPAFLLGEWRDIVDPWQLRSWESYRDASRLGRKTRLSESQRQEAWAIFERVWSALDSRGVVTLSGVYTKLAERLQVTGTRPYSAAVVDESQDLAVAQLRFLAVLTSDQKNGLFFAGDLGQRIFQVPFSWKSLGVDIRGRSTTLKVNYRTSHQIRTHADRLLSSEVSDVDGNVEERKGAVSIFNGPNPLIRIAPDANAEKQQVAAWLRERTAEGYQPHEMALIVRSEDQMSRATAAAESCGLKFRIVDQNADTTSGKLAICTMHFAKGLEFRAVAVMACDDEVVPLQERIDAVSDDADLEEVYSTERHLLYVACTRARDHLLVSAAKPGSEFLGDLAI